jgi:hypothetical protein
LTSYDLRRTNFHNGSLLDMTSQNAGAVLTRRLTRSLGLRTGYAYRIASTAIAGSEPLRVNDVELGLDFSRPLATSRRTTFSFASGSSISPADGGVGFRVTGNAGLTRLIGRTWKTRIGVDRSVRLLEGFVEPVLTNAVDATVGGNLSRRVSLSTSGSLSTGSVGLNGQTGNSYQNWTVASGLSFAMGRRAELGAQYFALDERFDNGVVLPTGLDDRRRRRQGVRISITFRAPLLGY